MQNLCDTIAKSWTLFRTIEIGNMKSIRWTKLKKMAKNWSKQVFLYRRNIIIEWSRCKKWATPLPTRQDHLEQSKYAI